MPFALAAGDITLIVLALLSAFMVYWLLIRIQGQLRGIPLAGNPIADALGTVNAWVIGATQWVVNGALSLLVNGVRDVVGWMVAIGNGLWGNAIAVVKASDAYLWWVVNNRVFPLAVSTKASNDLLWWIVNNRVFPLATSTLASLEYLWWVVNNRVFPLATQALSNSLELLTWQRLVVNPAIADLRSLIHSWNTLITRPVTGLLDRVSVIEHEWINIITRPVTGVLDRLRVAEGTISRLAPLVAAGALTIAQALNLRRLAEDPCYCLTQGAGQDIEWYEYAQALDLT